MLRLGARVMRMRCLVALAETLSVPIVSPPVQRECSCRSLSSPPQRRWLQHGVAETTESPLKAGVVTSEAQRLFQEVWDNIDAKYGRELVIPREIVWLNGAPGSGKGANTPFILKSRGLGRSISLSELLAANPLAHSFMEKGELIPENIVLEAVLSEIFDPVRDDGIGMIIDGYPRTPVQVDSLKLLHDKLMQLYDEKKDASPGVVFPKPSFKVVVLYVDEATSLERQQKRGVLQSQKSQRAQDAGADDPKAYGDIRSTDLDQEHSKKRYAIFKAHYGTLLRLKSFFPFHLIDAIGTLDDTRRQILRELRYQSSTDLDAVTYDAIRHLPMAKELSRLSRQQLTARLDTYALSHSELFKKIIEILDQRVLPILRRSGMAGEACFRTRNALFTRTPLAIDILTDVLSDRGYHVTYLPHVGQTPVRVDLTTGEIIHQHTVTHRFKIKFAVSSVRDLGDGEMPFRGGGGAGVTSQAESEIGISFMPSGTDHQAKYTGKSAREALVAECLTRDLEYHQEGLAELPSFSVDEEEVISEGEQEEVTMNVRTEPSSSHEEYK